MYPIIRATLLERRLFFLMKNALIINGVYNNFLEIRSMLWLNHSAHNCKELYQEWLSADEVDECFRIYNANRQRKKNNWTEICKWCYAIEHIPMYSDHRIIFGTLTFRDLCSTTQRTRARYVTKYLSSETVHYIANIDFGAKNGREHYHFVALVKDKMNRANWKCGASKFKEVPINSKDLRIRKNYLLKLNNHSYKESTKQKRIIRDRNDTLVKFITEVLEVDAFEKYKANL